MFDVGFWELCLIGVISLLVIGPERLPKAARIAGFWIGKTRHMVTAVKAEIKEELRAEELRQTMQEQSGMDEFQQLLDDTAKTAQEVQSSVADPQNTIDAKTVDKENP
jgi:sec-independent protein translocase protein TatB